MSEINSEQHAGRARSMSATFEAPDGAGSLAKMLHVLDLFTGQRPVWSTAELIEALEATRSTGYRYIKTLHDAGLLSSTRNGHYSLGPRIIEMDLQIRQSDPLLIASQGILEGLVENIGHSALLCTAYRDAVLCIGESRAPSSPENRFSRGQRRSLFQGAISKVIVAHFPHHRLKAVYESHFDEIRASGLGANWAEFRKKLGTIKRDGYAMTRGEFNPGVLGVAAPVLTEQGVALGSVGVAWAESRQDIVVEDAIRSVKRAAETITGRLSATVLDEREGVPQDHAVAR